MARKYVPRSEYLFEKLQPLLEEQLHLGRSYEGVFDKFEIILALSYADLNTEDISRHVWGPPGRFWWKQYSRTSGDRVYSRFVNQAKSLGDQWEPLKVGFFGGSARRFAEIADAMDKELSSHTLW